MRIAPIAVLALSIAFLAAACGDEPATLAKGGWTAGFTTGADPALCSIIAHNGQVGSVNATDASGVVIDVTDGANISCNVSGAGTFSVSASASQNGFSLTMTIPAISMDATPANPATGSVAFASPTTITSWNSKAPCHFYFSGSQIVDVGKIWVSFDCPDIENDGRVCALVSGVAAFQDCETF